MTGKGKYMGGFKSTKVWTANQNQKETFDESQAISRER